MATMGGKPWSRPPITMDFQACTCTCMARARHAHTWHVHVRMCMVQPRCAARGTQHRPPRSTPPFLKIRARARDLATHPTPDAPSVQVPMFAASGLHVRFLKVFEKSNYQTIKWVRYITKAGQYQHRI